MSDLVATLRSSVSGEVVAPGDDGYDTARAVWNGDIDREPLAVVRPVDAAAVVACVRAATAAGADFTVRGGGHNYAGHAVADGAVMIDLSALDAVVVDPATKRATVGGGATWAALDGASAAHGLAMTGGFISHTGVAGLTLGGGIGWLTRRCGLACDHLVGAEVVTADGQVVRASATDNADLFWALRGGGGNFGIVTEFEFALHEVAPMANLGLFFWTPDRARDALRFARDYIHQLPADAGGLIAGMSAPPMPFVPEELHFKPGFGVMVTNWGTPEEHAAAIEPLRALGPTFEFVTPIPYAALQQMFDVQAEWGSLAYEKAAYLDAITDDVVDLMIEYVPRISSPATFAPIFPLSGRYLEVGDDDTAFGGRRTQGWVFNISAAAPPAMADLFAADRAWVREFWTAVRPYARDSGSYVNFIAEEDDDRVRATYGPEVRPARCGEGHLGPDQRVPAQREHPPGRLTGARARLANSAVCAFSCLPRHSPWPSPRRSSTRPRPAATAWPRCTA